jgi:hypothetical protein
VAAAVEAALDEAGVELHEVLHLLLLDDALHRRLLRCGKVADWQEYGRGEPCAREVGEREGDAQSMVK